MNHDLSLRQKDAALEFLQNALKSGEHFGAGLLISVQIGAGETAKHVEFEVSGKSGQVLQVLQQALLEDRAMRVKLAQAEYAALGVLLDKEASSVAKSRQPRH